MQEEQSEKIREQDKSREGSSLGRKSSSAVSSGSSADQEPPLKGAVGTAAALGVKKKDKKSSLSSIFSVFTRKKSSRDKKDKEAERKKSSLAGLVETSGSLISPDVQKAIIDEEEAEEEVFKVPDERQLTSRQPVVEHQEKKRSEASHVSQTYIHLHPPTTSILGK